MFQHRVSPIDPIRAAAVGCCHWLGPVVPAGFPYVSTIHRPVQPEYDPHFYNRRDLFGIAWRFDSRCVCGGFCDFFALA
jgi:hypothetical protein